MKIHKILHIQIISVFFLKKKPTKQPQSFIDLTALDRGIWCQNCKGLVYINIRSINFSPMVSLGSFIVT